MKDKNNLLWQKKKKSNVGLEELKKEHETDVHKISLADLYNRLETNPTNGLSHAIAERNFKRDGPNTLSPPKTTPEWIKFCKTMFGGFAALLWSGGLLCIIAYLIQITSTQDTSKDNLYLGLVLFVVVIIGGCFAYYQDYRSGKVMESFKKMVPQIATVIREGQKFQIMVEKLALGDIVLISFGDRIPADVRIIECSSFKVDNSSLTGESKAQSRSPEFTHENPLETKNLAFFSSNAVEGKFDTVSFSNHVLVNYFINYTFYHTTSIEFTEWFANV